MSDIVIRRAQAADLPALLDIYNHYVRETPITFDIEPRTLDQRRAWFAQFAETGRYRCLVAARGGRAVGWASSAPFKDRAAYDTTIETSVYLAPEETGKGFGRALYAALFDALAGEDIHRAYGGVTLPNAASVALHERMGFRRVGTYPEVGRKFGRFWDVGLFMRDFNARRSP
jgi:phosphinothricin acetyltransferase